MNVWKKSNRSWRKARKRAVSPIIATILLVAITVVLAAVLYVLISGLTHGPGNTPIGSAFTAGAAVGSTCALTDAAVTATTNCVTNHWIYTLTVESSTVTMGSVLFEVKTPAGGILVNGAVGGYSVMPISGTAVCWEATPIGAMAMTTTCTAVSPITSASPLSNLYTIVIDMGTTTATTGQGLTLVTLGTGSSSGTTSVALP